MNFLFRPFTLLLTMISIIGCTSELTVDFVDRGLSSESNLKNKVPTVITSTPPAGAEDVESIITLGYSDSGSSKASSCNLSSLTNLTVTTACICDTDGECIVGVTGVSNYSGDASFAYTVTVNDIESAPGTINLTINSVSDSLYSTNFDTALDWTIIGDGMWECGDQTNDAFGPPSGHSGNSVCGTNLNANYTATNSNGSIQSPIINLTDAINPSINFWMDNEIEMSSCGADIECDGVSIALSINGASFVTLDYSDSGVSGLLPEAMSIGSTGLAGWSNTQPLGEWAQVKLDLYNLTTAGLTDIDSNDTVVVRFTFHTDSANGAPGTYIDDFEVVENLPETPRSFPYLQNFDTPDGWFATGGGNVWEIGDQTNGSFGPNSGVSDNSVAGTKLNANYVISGSTRFIDSYLTSPPLSLGENPNATISFFIFYDTHVLFDGANIQISVNDAPFITVDADETRIFGEEYTNNGNMDGLDGWSGSVGTWQNVILLPTGLSTPGLNSITSSDIIRVRFLFHAGRNDSAHPGFYIDNFSTFEGGGF